jgi:hypothetical protein
MGRWKKNKEGKMVYEPYSLVFYRKEHELFPETYAKKITGKEIQIIFKKLIKHYRLNCYLVFNARKNGHFKGYCIDLPYSTSFGMLSHEIAHAIDKKKRGRSKHDKKLMKIMGRVINYCKKKRYWEEELTKRTEIKIKTEPTKKELQLKKFEKRKSDLKRYKKKLEYYTKLYTNKIKKANRSISMLERYVS